jgi:hypothetical protein
MPRNSNSFCQHDTKLKEYIKVQNIKTLVSTTHVILVLRPLNWGGNIISLHS